MSIDLRETRITETSPPDWDECGWRMTNERRAVPKWWGTRLERLWEHPGGRLEWRKEWFPVPLPPAGSLS